MHIYIYIYKYITIYIYIYSFTSIIAILRNIRLRIIIAAYIHTIHHYTHINRLYIYQQHTSISIP